MTDMTSGTPFETITLTTLSHYRSHLHTLLEEAKATSLSHMENRTIVYVSYGHEWRPFGLPRRKRLLDSVILSSGVKECIVTDLREFLNNGPWYFQRGIPYRRGYLLHGPPGTGKTSFIQALAGELEYNICVLNVSERGLTDDRLNHLLMNTPERSITLLEDVDAAFTQRDVNAKEGFVSMVTFSGLLNALDGVASGEERIIFMTTNHPERLDPALIRPGRVDVKEYIGYATPEQTRRMFLRFYEGREVEADALVAKIGDRRVSPAQLQGLFVQWKEAPEEVVVHVEELWRRDAIVLEKIQAK